MSSSVPSSVSLPEAYYYLECSRLQSELTSKSQEITYLHGEIHALKRQISQDSHLYRSRLSEWQRSHALLQEEIKAQKKALEKQKQAEIEAIQAQNKLLLAEKQRIINALTSAGGPDKSARKSSARNQPSQAETEVESPTQLRADLNALHSAAMASQEQLYARDLAALQVRYDSLDSVYRFGQSQWEEQKEFYRCELNLAYQIIDLMINQWDKEIEKSGGAAKPAKLSDWGGLLSGLGDGLREVDWVRIHQMKEKIKQWKQQNEAEQSSQQQNMQSPRRPKSAHTPSATLRSPRPASAFARTQTSATAAAAPQALASPLRSPTNASQLSSPSARRRLNQTRFFSSPGSPHVPQNPAMKSPRPNPNPSFAMPDSSDEEDGIDSALFAGMEILPVHQQKLNRLRPQPESSTQSIFGRERAAKQPASKLQEEMKSTSSKDSLTNSRPVH